MRSRTAVVAVALVLSLLAHGGPAAASDPGIATWNGADAAARPSVPAAATTSARTFRVNLARPSDYVAQANFVQCVGASVQMMLNIARRGADRSARTQHRLQVEARALSGPTPPGFIRHGASIRGWVASLNRRGTGLYRLVGADTLQEAMQIAMVAIQQYRRPVGLLVWRGRHAWVMSGYVATYDARHGGRPRVTRAYILDPLHPHGSIWGPSPTPGTSIPVAAVGRQFVRRELIDTTSIWARFWRLMPGYDQLNGKYVMVVPIGPVPRGFN